MKQTSSVYIAEQTFGSVHTGLPHYNSPHYNTDFSIKQSCLGSQMVISSPEPKAHR